MKYYLRLLAVLGILLIGAIIGCVAFDYFTYDEVKEANYNTLPYKVELIDAYDDYYKYVRIIADAPVVTDSLYHEYAIRQGRVDFLNEMQEGLLTWDGYYIYMKNNNLEPLQKDLK